MLELLLKCPGEKPLEVLCLGAHADDIEIGCGGAVLEVMRSHPRARFHWVVLSAHDRRGPEAAECAARFLEGAAEKEVVIERFRDGFFPYQGGEIKEFFETLKSEVDPDLIFTHHRHDLHQDHRLVSELTWNTFRDHLILEFEIPKYDGDLGVPNLFFPLDSETCERKIRHILESFESQRQRSWFSEETFRSLLRLRGVESRAPSGYAEGFHARKVRFGGIGA
jgi:LmbE family N-acetylglucosaminyl deacetylase